MPSTLGICGSGRSGPVRWRLRWLVHVDIAGEAPAPFDDHQHHDGLFAHAALASTEEAVALRRELAEARPEAFLPDLATSLHNLALDQSEHGQLEAALASAEEAVEAIWPLFLRLPAAFEHYATVMLDNLRDCLAALGRPPTPTLLQRLETLAAHRSPAPKAPPTA